MATIVHFTTVHPRDDSRIRSKMMAILEARFPGQVALFVQDGPGNERDAKDGYEIIDTGPRLTRFKRMSVGGWRIFRAVMRIGPTIAHFHDPELIPWGAALRLFGIHVIYDVHEDYPEAVRGNLRLPPIARRLLPSIVRFVEYISVQFFSAIITVTPRINQRFPAHKAVMVRNWPVVGEFKASMNTPMRERPNEFAYVGSITLHRNIIGMIDAIEMIRDKGAILRLAGEFLIYSEQATVRNHLGWGNVRFDGWVTREEIAQILGNVRAGLVVLQPLERFKHAYPIKMFEYMAAGLPVISSDFPLWREIVEGTECGLLVNPEKPQELADAMRWILENPEAAEAMGKRGQAAVLQWLNWECEAKTLIATYEAILGR